MVLQTRESHLCKFSYLEDAESFVMPKETASQSTYVIKNRSTRDNATCAHEHTYDEYIHYLNMRKPQGNVVPSL